MNSFALYQDPLRGEVLKISGNQIGMSVVPRKLSFSDPILLRHILCLVIVVHNSFHLILCCRQLKLCKRTSVPPKQMEGILSQEAFQVGSSKIWYTYLFILQYIL